MPDRSGKLTQKVLSLLIALCLIATLLPAVTAEGRETPFAAKLAAGTVFYADQDLKTETGTLAKDAVVLVTEEKGRADHISYKHENKKASAWVPKEAAAVLAATPTDLAPYLSDENLTLTLPAPVTEEPAEPVVIPDEGGDTPADDIPDDTPADVIPSEVEDTPTDVIPSEAEDTPTDVIPSEAEDTPTDVIPSEAEGEVEESVDSPSEPGQEPETQEPADPSVIPDEGGDTPADVIPDDTPAVIPTEAEGEAEESVDSPSETDPAGQEPGEALTDESGEEPAEGESATPTDLEPELRDHSFGSIDMDSDLADLSALEAPEQLDGSESSGEPEIIYAVVDGELVAAAYIPYFYDEKNTPVETDIVLPEVREQNPYGTCWAFAAVGGMEIDLIKDEHAGKDINLSELYLAYFTAHNYDYPDGGMGGDNIAVTVLITDENYLDIGGANYLAYRMLASLIGTTTEDDNPYPADNRSDQDKEPASYTISAQLTGAYLIDPKDQGARDAIKEQIRAHGSVAASIYMVNEVNEIMKITYSGGAVAGYVGFSGTNKAMYGTVPGTNHDILLVGWDDEFDKNKFLHDNNLPAPDGNGAWLVRNSWGGSNEKLSRDGYFWISYYDKGLASKDITVYDADVNRNAVTNDQGVQTDAGFQVDQYAYSYDKTPYSGSDERNVVSIQGEAVLTQKFTIRAKETLTAVGVETGSNDLLLQVRILFPQESGDVPDISGSREASFRGFYRVPVWKNNPDGTKSAYTFDTKTEVTVEVTYTSTKGSGTEIRIPYQKAGTVELGNGSEWYTFTNKIDGGGFKVNGEDVKGDPRLKVYTRDSKDAIVVKEDDFTLDKTAISNAEIRSEYMLTATFVPAEVTNQHIYWSSSNPAVATVTAAGDGKQPGQHLAKITTGNTTGKAVITAVTVSGGISKTCEVTIPSEEPTAVKIDGLNGATEYTINNANAGNFWFGSTLTLRAKFTPSYATERKLVWSSSKSSVLKYTGTDSDGGGRFIAMDNGTTTITVSHTKEDGTVISDRVVITLDLHRYVSSVTLDRTSASITQDETLRLNATISPADAEKKSVIWTSSNSSIASVDGAGYVYGQGWGTAVITVTTLDGNKTASCTVEVTPRDPVEAFVFRLYRVCLLRDPDAGGMRYWVDRLRSGEETGASAVFGFYHSNEMKARNLPNDQYLTRAYEGIMGRGPDAGGYAYWMGQLEAGMSRAYLVSGFLQSNEFDALCRSYGITKGSYSSTEPRDQNAGVTGFVSRLYTKLLGRMYDENGLNYWCSIILKDPVRATLLKVALEGFLHSNEFLNSRLGDMAYVKVLYRTFLGREADPGGLQYWMSNLTSGMTRDKVAEGFATSNEFANIMARYGFYK